MHRFSYAHTHTHTRVRMLDIQFEWLLFKLRDAYCSNDTNAHALGIIIIIVVVGCRRHLYHHPADNLIKVSIEKAKCGNALVQSKQSENLYFDLEKIVSAKLITIQSINMLHI